MKKKRRSLLRLLLVVAVTAFVGLNALAYMQALAMSHIAAPGQSVQRAEDLKGLAKLKVLLTGARTAKSVNLSDPASVGLTFRTLRIPGGSTQSLELWQVPAKDDGRWVLLFHGYRSSKSALIDEALAFHRLGWNCLLVDLPAHGGSTGERTSIGLYEGADVAAVSAYARRQLKAQRLVLYGVSMGAAAVLRGIAREQVLADAVILEAPFDRFSDTVKNRFALMGLPSFPTAQLLLFWGSVQFGTNAFKYRLSEEAQSVHCPALVMAGQADQRAPLSDAQNVAAAMQGPEQLLVFEHAGHESFLKNDPKKWGSAVEKFLR